MIQSVWDMPSMIIGCGITTTIKDTASFFGRIIVAEVGLMSI